jgi:hypothetical protein
VVVKSSSFNNQTKLRYYKRHKVCTKAKWNSAIWSLGRLKAKYGWTCRSWTISRVNQMVSWIIVFGRAADTTLSNIYGWIQILTLSCGAHPEANITLQNQWTSREWFRANGLVMVRVQPSVQRLCRLSAAVHATPETMPVASGLLPDCGQWRSNVQKRLTIFGWIDIYKTGPTILACVMLPPETSYNQIHSRQQREFFEGSVLIIH